MRRTEDGREGRRDFRRAASGRGKGRLGTSGGMEAGLRRWTDIVSCLGPIWMRKE
jgi:hypothetical protein